MRGALFVVEFKDRLTYRPPSLITPSGRHFCSAVDLKRKGKEAVDSRLLPTASCPLFLPTVEEYPFVSNGDLQFEDYARAPGRQVVKSGRLRSLVGWLTADENKSREFERVFLLTYRSFVPAERLLELLVERFRIETPAALRRSAGCSWAADANCRFRSEFRFPIQKKVLEFLFRWIRSDFGEFRCNPPLFRSFLDFLDESDEFTPLQRIWATELRAEVRRLSAASPRTPFVVVIKRRCNRECVTPLRLADCDPPAFAQQLTLLHFQLFRAIRGSELVDVGWTRADKHARSPHLLQMIDFSTKLTFWTVREIVDEAAVQKRAALMRRVLEVMVECEKLRNFTAVVALNAALNHSAVFRLQRTKAKLNEKDREQLAHFDSLCEPHGREIAARLRSAAAQPAVPFVGAFLSQLFFLHTSRPTFLDGNEPAEEAEICFRKCRKTAAVINSLLKFRRRPFEISPNWKLLKALICVDPSRGFADRDELEAFLYERSRRIEPN